MDNLSAVETILLAFQNYILMLGTSVMIPSMLVPLMGGSAVSAKYFQIWNVFSCCNFYSFSTKAMLYFIFFVCYIG